MIKPKPFGEQPEPTTEWGHRAAAYAAYAVPKNRPYARRLVALIGPRTGERILDVACGPGVVAIEAALAQEDGGEVLATDLEPAWEPLVDQAASQSGLRSVNFRAMAGERLGLEDERFDAVFCQFGLMFMAEPAAALAEFRRVLRSGGRLGVAVWSTPDKVAHFAAMRALVEALPTLADGDGRSPLALGEAGLIEELVATAGFVDLVVERFTSSHIVEPEAEWQRLSADGRFAGRLAGMGPDQRRQIRERVFAALEMFRDGTEIRLSSEAVLVLGRRP